MYIFLKVQANAFTSHLQKTKCLPYGHIHTEKCLNLCTWSFLFLFAVFFLSGEKEKETDLRTKESSLITNIF